METITIIRPADVHDTIVDADGSDDRQDAPRQADDRVDGTAGLAPDAPLDVATRAKVLRAADQLAARVIARRSPFLLQMFAAFCARDLASSFQKIRLLGELPQVRGPLVIYTNHPSWWDAELYAWLAVTSFPDRRGFAPMDTVNLARYSILARLGAFPVWPGTFAGASAFLITAARVLQAPDALLLVAVEGRFRDVRHRPIRPMPGLAHLARRVPEATFVPLALDYVFWSERRPNLLLRFGEPMSGSALAGLSTGAITARFADALEASMSDLADAGQSRDPQRFVTLLKGRDGINIFYDLWRRGWALAKGMRFSSAHRSEP